MREIAVQPVDRETFAPFGDLIEADAGPGDRINAGTTRRFSDLTRIQLLDEDAQACVHIYRADAQQEPVVLRHMERHPFGSQLFMPLQGQAFIAVVAPPGAPPTPDDLSALLVSGGRGVNLAPGVWHHPLLSLASADFLIVERTDPNRNLEECVLAEPLRVAMLPGVGPSPR